MPKEWGVFIDGDGDPHLVMVENGVQRMATKDECERAALLLNEEGSNIIRLWCRNGACPEGDKGWIERTREMASKTVIICDVCNRPMER